MIQASLLPYLDYSDLRGAGTQRRFRLFGQLEAFRAEDQVWINSGSFSVAADLHQVPVYILPSAGTSDFTKELTAEEQPQIVPWKQISTLPAKTPIFIAGNISLENGQPEFRSEPKQPLLVVLYGGDKGSLIKKAIRGGRQLNEYWNPFTLVSLIAGSITLFLLGFFSFARTEAWIPTTVAITLSLSPIVPMLPPGVIFLVLYRYFWKKARALRSERDMQRLPIRFFRNFADDGFLRKLENGDRVTAPLPDGERYAALAGQGEARIRSVLASNQTPEGVLPLSVPPADSKTYVFGTLAEGKIHPPGDPMIESVMIRGNPELNAQRCSAAARKYEVLSALLFGLAVIPNFFLVFLILRYLIR
jgi:hypothetical protein